MDPGWARVLEPVERQLKAMGAFLRGADDGGVPGFLPEPSRILRALERPFEDVRVLIAGQDPYPTPGHSVGLAFAVDPKVRPLPRSLANIYQELQSDLRLAPVAHGDLTPWTDQGVLLLNRVLTVAPGVSGSHHRKGWEEITEAAVRALVARGTPLVSVLWGNNARKLLPVLTGTDAICSAHPSPLSASRGFFGSRPFSRTNALLAARGAAPVEWSLASRPAAASH
ncbi:MAG TPA: uracil-DNA glycosylase [Micrococcaceae bacterium]